MKITIEQSPQVTETEITIKCNTITEELEQIISAIRLCDNIVIGKSDGAEYLIPSRDILYFDSSDSRIFLYTTDKVYETPLKLYQIEEKFTNTSFVRISKTTIVNLRKVSSIERESYGRSIAVLLNSERVIISRQYMDAIRQKLRLS